LGFCELKSRQRKSVYHLLVMGQPEFRRPLETTCKNAVLMQVNKEDENK